MLQARGIEKQTMKAPAPSSPSSEARPHQGPSGEETSTAFPFSAIVDQDQAKEALILAAINPAVQGILFLGEKGTGKTTMVRSLAGLLPDTRVVELPLGSTEEMILGTVDVERALATGEIRTRPGILSRAHGQILYIDEVNLLADHLVDVILDAAATGQYRLEREGVSALIPARFTLVGSMNPEEGWLRPQLLDRFGLAVHVRALTSVEDRSEVYRRAHAFLRDPQGFVRAHEKAQIQLRSRLEAARGLLPKVEVPDEVAQKCIAAVLELGVATHRAELAALEGAAARAAWHGRDHVEWEDVQEVLPLALLHRLPDTDPGDPTSWDRIDRILQEGAKDRAPHRKETGWFPTPFFRKKKAKRQESSVS